jgi:hypothetical protein
VYRVSAPHFCIGLLLGDYKKEMIPFHQFMNKPTLKVYIPRQKSLIQKQKEQTTDSPMTICFKKMDKLILDLYTNHK